MTRDEILNMQAGREMDALIAEKVMGFEVIGDGKVVLFKDNDYAYLVPDLGGQWSPSADISAAWQVVEKFAYYKIERLGKMHNVYIENDDNIRTGISQEESLSLAICRAALLAFAPDETSMDRINNG